MRTRIATAAAVSALLMVAACGSGGSDDASGSGKKSVTVSVYTSAYWAIPATVAKDQGYFEDAGLDAKLEPAPSGLSAQQLLASNAADLAFVSPAQAIAAEQEGQDVIYMCGGYHVNPASIVAPAKSKLPSVSDGATWEEVLKSLKGKTIGIPTPLGTGTANLMVKTLESVGLKSGDYSLVNIGVGAQAQAAIAAGRVDAANVVTPGGEAMVANGIAKELFYMPEGPASFQLIGGAWEARRSWVEDNPKTAKAFCDAMTKSYAYVQDDANADTVDDYIRKLIGGADASDEALALVRSRSNSLDASITEADFDKTLAALIDLDIVKRSPAVSYADTVDIQ